MAWENLNVIVFKMQPAPCRLLDITRCQIAGATDISPWDDYKTSPSVPASCLCLWWIPASFCEMHPHVPRWLKTLPFTSKSGTDDLALPPSSSSNPHSPSTQNMGTTTPPQGVPLSFPPPGIEPCPREPLARLSEKGCFQVLMETSLGRCPSSWPSSWHRSTSYKLDGSSY